MSACARVWRLAALLAGPMMLAPAAGAQSRSAEVQAATQRAVVRFNAAALNLARTSARVDSITRARMMPETPETVRAGTIVARVGGNSPRPNEAGFAGVVMNQSWIEMQAALGSSAARVGGAVELFWRRDTVWYGRGRRRYQLVVSSGGRNGPSQWLQSDVDSLEAVRAVLWQYSDVALNLLSPRTRQWASGWTPTIRPTDAQWERVAILLATSPSSRARDCYTGVLAECAAVLNLASAPDNDPWRAWYRPADWPEAVAEWAPKDPADSLLVRACSRKRDLASCELAITRFAPRNPLPGIATHTLLATALERGGPDAFARLAAATGAPTEILQATAGVDPMMLVAEWRTRVSAARPASPTPTLAQGGAMAFWVIALGLIATRRRP